jgi:hypothetical protein
MRHRHLTLEQYELALEEDGSAAVRLRGQAAACPVCTAALAHAPLAPVLLAWAPPASMDGPVDWLTAFRRAVAPSSRQRRRRWSYAGRLLAVAALLVGITVSSAMPAAASTGPNSVLYPVRGLEEDARWRLTPVPDRASFEADLASAYLWQARTSAARHDSKGYQAAMERFFMWAERLKADIAKAPPDKRSSARAAVSAALPLVSPAATSGQNQSQARKAESIIEDVQSQEGEGEHDGGQHRGSGPECEQPGRHATGSPRASPPIGGMPAPNGSLCPGRDSAGDP